MHDTRHPSEEDDRLDDAALWFARVDSGTVDQAAFDRWRDADPRNAVAYARIAALWQGMADSDAPPAEEIVALPSPHWHVPRRAALGGLAVLALAGGGLFASRSFARESASTGTGERLAITLPGKAGRVMLNTNSRIFWRASDQDCALWLDRGEIALDLPGQSPPVRIHCGSHTATLAAGRYNAQLVAGLLDLTVIQGAATVDAESTGASTRVAALHRALLGTQVNTGRVSSEAVAKMLAWPQGEILFDDEPLATAVEEYNRHLARKIVILEPSIGNIRIGGRFTSNQPDTFLDALQASFGIRVVRDGDNILLTGKK